MTFGQQVDLEESRDMLQLFLEYGYNEIDSAYVYNEGKTELYLGEILKYIDRSAVRIATKANPRVTGKLDAESVKQQLNGSLESMEIDYVDVFYLHMPDYTTSIIQTLEACAELHSLGKFKRFGISNYPAWMLSDIWHVCDKEGWEKPSVYQGLYNALGRNIEGELIPAARYLGVSIYAFNPLAGGLLTGKHGGYDTLPTEGRFALRKSYQQRYWNDKVVDASAILAKESLQRGLEPTEAALRWLAHHSMLKFELGDAVLVGASSINQLRQNLDCLSKNELPETLSDIYEAKWEDVRYDSPQYFKSL
jgi:aflatoxin B1 aldehyde reductase